MRIPITRDNKDVNNMEQGNNGPNKHDHNHRHDRKQKHGHVFRGEARNGRIADQREAIA